MTSSDLIALAAAVISLLSLVSVIVFALLGRRYTKEQIAETQRQFRDINTPDVEISVHCQLNPPEERGVYLTATNHHPTITVNDLTVYAAGDSPTRKDAFVFMFLTFDDLGPTRTLKERSTRELGSVLEEHFPNHEPSGAVISKTEIEGIESFPMKLHYSFLPRIHGAEKIEGVRDLYFQVIRKKD